jgi:hypothetical protein
MFAGPGADAVRFVVPAGRAAARDRSFQESLVQDAEATVLPLATHARCFHVLVCPDKIACHWAQGDNERPVPRAGDKQLDFVEMAPR